MGKPDTDVAHVPLSDIGHAERLKIPPPLLVPSRLDKRCVMCRQIRHEPGKRYTIAHHDPKKLKTSAARGCAMCQFFFREFVYNTYRGVNSQSTLSISYAYDLLSIVDYQRTTHTYELYNIEGKSSEWPKPLY